MKMFDMPRIRVDFNEMVEENLVLLSSEDTKVNSEGDLVTLFEGLKVYIYDEDSDELGKPDNLIASGLVERNKTNDWSAQYGGVVE